MSGFIIACADCGSRRLRSVRVEGAGGDYRCEDCRWTGQPSSFDAPATYGAHLGRGRFQ